MKNLGIPDLKAGHKTEGCASDIAQKIERSIAYMTQHLDKPLQVAALAAQASISPSHYFVLFKRQTGHAPIDFFIHLRMRQACRLLDSTYSSVKEVAATLGYHDPFYFSRVFKSVNRIAPSEYRAISKERKEALRNAVPAGIRTSAVKKRHPQSPVGGSLKRTGQNGNAKLFQQTHRKKRSIFHSATADFCHNK